LEDAIIGDIAEDLAECCIANDFLDALHSGCWL
jgi:hypothetical protein